jgi:EAL domain-containing protein (putative c-di-GMP-specific phosphodiesterase class I)
MLVDRMDAAIVRSTIRLAHNPGMSVVAEGVEDEQTWAELRPLGGDVVQGYVLSRPLPPAAADEFVADRGARRAARD